MKKMRFVALALAAMMLLGLLAGCSGDGSKTTTTAATTVADGTTAAGGTTAATTAASGEATTTPTAGGSSEPDHITFGETISFQTDPCMWYETECVKGIIERANVEIENFYLDGDKYSLALAGGDLQDIMYTADSSKVAEILSSGLALDMMPYIDSDMPNLRNEAYSFFVGLIPLLTGDESKLYFLPEHVGKELPQGGVELARGYYVRWDWYKEIGAPEINNDDDYIAAIEAMVAAHPTTEDGKTVYGTGINDSLTNWGSYSCFIGGNYVNAWTFQNRYYMQSVINPDTLINGYMDVENSPFWNSMIFYNKLWNKGLLDPDSFTMTYDEVNTKHAAGQYAACLLSKNSKLYNTTRADDPETLAGYVNIPSPNQLVFADNPNPSGWFPSFTVYLAAKSDNTKAAMRLWNEVFDLDSQREVYCGPEGKYWNYVDGVPTLTDEAIAIYSGKSDIDNGLVGLGGSGPFVVLQTSEYHPDGGLLDLFDSTECRALGLTPLQADVAAFYNVTIPSEASYKFVTEGKTYDWTGTYGTELLAGAMTAIPSDIGRILEKCQDILYRGVAELVMAESQAEFNAIQASMLDEMKAADEATAYEWCLNEFNKAIETLKPIMGY